MSRGRYKYSDTIGNLKIGKDTRVIFQGFTGRQATQNARQSLEYGTKLVGGVTPGKDGEHLGLPVLPTVRAVVSKAKDQLHPHATAVYVAANHAAGAIEEALEAEIPLIVAVTEHIPLGDLARIHQMLRSQSKSRLVGANSPGIISAVGHCRIGFHPLPAFQAGKVGIVARSGTLSYETVASTTRAGLGQSLVIGMGGDMVVGTDFVDALTIFEQDQDTEAIIMIGEIGGFAEQEAAVWIKHYRRRVPNPKPIMALVAGLQAPPGRVMGHDGALYEGIEGHAKSKIDALRDAGAVITNHPSKFGDEMSILLKNHRDDKPLPATDRQHSPQGFLESSGQSWQTRLEALQVKDARDHFQLMLSKPDKYQEESEARKYGIVLIRLDGEGSIGTLVNGAGLAMNTIDAISNLGGKCANFLDTGGKATSETVQKSFQLILGDARVKTILVNIFGGLTLCDMIANGILLAYKDLRIKIPVVVRLRGTNEGIGQKIIAESGLPLYSYDNFEEAATKTILLAE